MGRSAYHRGVEATLAATLSGLVGLAIGAVAVLAFRLSEGAQTRTPEEPEPAVPPDVAKVLAVLRSAGVVVGPHDEVRQASAPARSFGLVRGSRIVVEDLLELVRQVRRDGEIRQCDLELPRGRFGQDVLSVSARVAPLGSELILVLVEDRTKERRIDTIRRDFVANVSHELKTPIGALVLLAEAVQHAADDPEAVQRFAGRMQVESDRLTRLVQQIIELSRVQADDPVEEAASIELDQVIDGALDRSRVDAQTKQVALVRAGDTGLTVTGSAQQLIIALGNLVENAVTYSPEHTRVVVDVRRRPAATFEGFGPMAEIAVSDQGVGIPEKELERVFERFYRVDRARSRQTGGTGLGLSIVKHVAASHGGAVDVWSVEGEGSTFTLLLPLRPDPAAEPSASSAPIREIGSVRLPGPADLPHPDQTRSTTRPATRPATPADASAVRRPKEASR
nr:ATP-binding protein [Actinopolymorpha cephalotaxi]